MSIAPVGIVFVDREFRYVRVNEKLAAIRGSATVGEYFGRTVAEVVPALWAQLETSYRRVLRDGRSDAQRAGEWASPPRILATFITGSRASTL